MNDNTDELHGDKLTDDDLDRVVGGGDGPPTGPGDGTSAH